MGLREAAHAQVRLGEGDDAGADHPLDLDFFGVAVRVDGVDAATARLLRVVYERQAPAPGSRDPRVVVRVERDGRGAARIVAGDRTMRIQDRAVLAHHVHLVLVGVAAAACARARVLHGCAVERSGRVLVVLAPSGGGKTTLAVALVGRGWRILSDDFVVLAADGAVRPFLRRVNLLPDSVTRLGLAVPEGALTLRGPRGMDKWMIDIESLFGDSASPGGRLCTLFVAPASAPGPCSRKGPQRCYALEFDRAPDVFVRALAAVEGVRSVRRMAGGGRTLGLSLEPGARLVRPLEALCAEHGVVVLSVERPAGSSRVSGAPCVRPMSTGEAARACLAYDLGLGGRRFLSGTEDGDVLVALMQLRRSLACVEGRAWRLTPGDLAATIDLLERLAEGAAHETGPGASGEPDAAESRPAR